LHRQSQIPLLIGGFSPGRELLKHVGMIEFSAGGVSVLALSSLFLEALRSIGQSRSDRLVATTGRIGSCGFVPMPVFSLFDGVCL
jgi:hypothetical protein